MIVRDLLVQRLGPAFLHSAITNKDHYVSQKVRGSLELTIESMVDHALSIGRTSTQCTSGLRSRIGHLSYGDR